LYQLLLGVIQSYLEGIALDSWSILVRSLSGLLIWLILNRLFKSNYKFIK
jgi:hypothetical protein